MWFFFGDDSRQLQPTRPRMGPLVAAGGVLIDGSRVKVMEHELMKLCQRFGFPPNEEFKWSPGRELWMRNNLIGGARRDFFFEALHLAASYQVKALVVAADTNCRRATDAESPEEDVTRLLLERVHHGVPIDSRGCIVIIDRPSGSREDDDRFLVKSLEHLQVGTGYVKHDRIALNVLSTPSKLVRLLQLADVVTSCTNARISGEAVYSPLIFEKIIPLFASYTERRGGVGLKIHPDFKYANLYHWLLGDSHSWRGNCGAPFPLGSRPYSNKEDEY